MLAFPVTVGAAVSVVSYVIILAPDQEADLMAAVRRLIDTHPSTAGRDEIDFPYITYCTRAQRD